MLTFGIPHSVASQPGIGLLSGGNQFAWTTQNLDPNQGFVY